jgi:DNA-binding NtrC family response regulator
LLQIPNLAAGNILVIDDQENMCWVLSRILSERGHIVRTAQTRERALKLLSDFDCHVAIVDYRLPDSNGIDLIVEMMARVPRMRAILMTSYGNATIHSQTLEKGLFAYFDKPFNNDVMIETVELAVHERQEDEGSGGVRAQAQTLFPGRRRTTS